MDRHMDNIRTALQSPLSPLYIAGITGIAYGAGALMSSHFLIAAGVITGVALANIAWMSGLYAVMMGITALCARLTIHSSALRNRGYSTDKIIQIIVVVMTILFTVGVARFSRIFPLGFGVGYLESFIYTLSSNLICILMGYARDRITGGGNLCCQPRFNFNP